MAQPHDYHYQHPSPIHHHPAPHYTARNPPSSRFPPHHIPTTAIAAGQIVSPIIVEQQGRRIHQSTAISPRFDTQQPSPHRPEYRQMTYASPRSVQRQSTRGSDEMGLPDLTRIPSMNVQIETSTTRNETNEKWARGPLVVPMNDGQYHHENSVAHRGAAIAARSHGWNEYEGGRYVRGHDSVETPSSVRTTAVVPVMAWVVNATEPVLLCKILSFVSSRDKYTSCMIVTKSWKLCVHNALSYSVVKLDFSSRLDSIISIRFSYIWFRLKLLQICDARFAQPGVLVSLLKHVQSVRAIWLKSTSSLDETPTNKILDETFAISLFHVVGRSCEIIRLDNIFSIGIGYALSESCSNLRQLILSNWTNDETILGLENPDVELTTLGFGGRVINGRRKKKNRKNMSNIVMNGLTSVAISVENGTALHPLLVLLDEIGRSNEYLERLLIQFGMEIDVFAKGMKVTTDGVDPWQVFERVLIERLQWLANRFANKMRTLQLEHDSLFGMDEVDEKNEFDRKLTVTLTFRENCVNLYAFAHRVRSSLPDRLIHVRIQKTTRK